PRMASELAPVTGLSVINLGASLAPNWMSTLLVLASSVLRFSAWLPCDCMLLRLEVPPAFAEEHDILTTSWPNFLSSLPILDCPCGQPCGEGEPGWPW